MSPSKTRVVSSTQYKESADSHCPFCRSGRHASLSMGEETLNSCTTVFPNWKEAKTQAIKDSTFSPSSTFFKNQQSKPSRPLRRLSIRRRHCQGTTLSQRCRQDHGPRQASVPQRPRPSRSRPHQDHQPRREPGATATKTPYHSHLDNPPAAPRT